MNLRDELNAHAASLRALEDDDNATYKSRELERGHLARQTSRNNVGASQRFIEHIWQTEQHWGEIGDRAADGDPAAIDDALTYLEVMPRFFRSGYLAERLIKRLVQAPDLVPYTDRVRLVALGYARSAAQREIGLIGNLVGKAWSPGLEETLLHALAQALANQKAAEVTKLELILQRAQQWRRSAAHQKRL